MVITKTVAELKPILQALGTLADLFLDGKSIIKATRLIAKVSEPCEAFDKLLQGAQKALQSHESYQAMTDEDKAKMTPSKIVSHFEGLGINALAEKWKAVEPELDTTIHQIEFEPISLAEADLDKIKPKATLLHACRDLIQIKE